MSHMQEEWRPVVGYEGVYEVSNNGRVKRIKKPDWITPAETIRAIQALRSSGSTLASIALKFGLSIASVHRNCSKIEIIEWSPHLLSPSLDTKGYPFVALSLDGAVKLLRVHTLVVGAFIAVVPPKMTVNHKDGVKTNNELSNLEIASYSENNFHAINVLKVKHKGPRGERAPKSKLTSDQVLAIRKARAEGARWVDLARQYGVDVSNVRAIVNRKSWTHI